MKKAFEALWEKWFPEDMSGSRWYYTILGHYMIGMGTFNIVLHSPKVLDTNLEREQARICISLALVLMRVDLKVCLEPKREPLAELQR